MRVVSELQETVLAKEIGSFPADSRRGGSVPSVIEGKGFVADSVGTI